MMRFKRIVCFCVAIIFLCANGLICVPVANNLVDQGYLNDYLDVYPRVSRYNLAWFYYQNGVLEFKKGEGDKGAIIPSASHDNPWDKYKETVKEIIVDNSVYTIGKGAFEGFDKIESITIPFVGGGDEVVGGGYEGLPAFGYIFGCIEAYEPGPEPTIYNRRDSFDAFLYDCNGYCIIRLRRFRKNNDLSNPFRTSGSRLNKYFFINAMLGCRNDIDDENYYKYYFNRFFGKEKLLYDSLACNCSWYTSYSHSVTSGTDCIASYVFNIPRSLHEVVVTDETIIHSGAFNNCKYLTSIRFNKNVEEIGQFAFQNCISLKEVVIPNGYETGGNAFVGTIFNCDFGDVNIDKSIDMKDVLYARILIANGIIQPHCKTIDEPLNRYIGSNFTSCYLRAVDVNRDEEYNLKDVLLIRKYLSGLIETL